MPRLVLVNGEFLATVSDRQRLVGINTQRFIPGRSSLGKFITSNRIHMSTDLGGVGLRENTDFMRLAGRCIPEQHARRRYPVEFVRLLTGH